MNKRTIIILAIIFSVISLIYIIINYYGFDRYVAMYIHPSEKYIKSYSKLPKGSDSKIIVSFTTTPEKIKGILPMINSLLDQTVKVNQIALVIPYTYNGQKYDIPEYLKKIVNIFPVAKDYGDGTNLVPILLREKDPSAIIIGIKDNQIYGKDFIESLVENSEKNCNSVIVDENNRAILIKPEFYEYNVIDRTKDTYNYEWFIDHAKESRKTSCNETYKML